MFKHYFELIEGLAIYPIVSLSIFFLFFLALLIWVLTVDKNYIKEVEKLPLDDTELINDKSNIKE